MVRRILDLFRRILWSPEKYAKHLGVKIGKECSIATRYFGSEPYLIEIGNHVQITSDVRFFTHGGGWVFRHKYPNFDCFGKIKIGHNVYIGNCALIMPGVTVGNDVVIGAGSVVTKSIPDNSVAAGNPARILGKLQDLEIRLLPHNVDSKLMTYEEKRSFLASLEEVKLLSK